MVNLPWVMGGEGGISLWRKSAQNWPKRAGLASQHSNEVLVPLVQFAGMRPVHEAGFVFGRAQLLRATRPENASDPVSQGFCAIDWSGTWLGPKGQQNRITEMVSH